LPSDQPPIEGGLSATAGTPTLHATGEVVRLGRAAADAGLERIGERTVTEHERDLALREQARLDAAADLRRWLAEKVVPSFLLANGLTLAALAVLVALDEFNILNHLITPADRIVTSQVMIALLGATTVQVGAIAAIIARSLFPSRSGGQ
jgi:hypothetical protein